MKKSRGLVLLIAAVIGCSGGGTTTSTTGSAQGAAKLWLEATMKRDAARVRELCIAEAQEKCARVAEATQEKFGDNMDFRWESSAPKGSDLGWSAMGPGGVVFLMVREVSAGEWRVADADTSW